MTRHLSNVQIIDHFSFVPIFLRTESEPYLPKITLILTFIHEYQLQYHTEKYLTSIEKYLQKRQMTVVKSPRKIFNKDNSRIDTK